MIRSLVMPVRNEAQGRLRLMEEIAAVRHVLPADSEVIFVNDSSPDASAQELETIRRRHPGVAVIEFARLPSSLRFLGQWIVSEKGGESSVPTVSWCFSLTGGGLLPISAIHRRDPPFIPGQASGLFVLLRNIALIKKRKAAL